MNNLLLALLLGYLLGSIPFSQLVGRLAKGIDLRKVGSGNVGGNNLIANAGIGWGLLGGGLDAAKGAAALWLAQTLQVGYPEFLLAGLAAVAGHNWSIWLGFRGGKGLATALGVVAWLAWPEAIVCAVAWAVVNKLTDNGTTASIVAFSGLGILLFLTGRPIEYSILALGIVVLVFIASLKDLLKVMRSADKWTDNFVAPKTTKRKK